MPELVFVIAEAPLPLRVSPEAWEFCLPETALVPDQPLDPFREAEPLRLDDNVLDVAFPTEPAAVVVKFAELVAVFAEFVAELVVEFDAELVAEFDAELVAEFDAELVPEFVAERDPVPAAFE